MVKHSSGAPLAQIVGIRLRQHREHAGLTQDEIAEAAQDLGLRWGRSSVAELERGQRQLLAEELLALPFIIDRAIKRQMGVSVSFFPNLDSLLEPGRKETLALSDRLQLTPDQVEKWLAGAAVPPQLLTVTGNRLSDPATITDADRKAARALGTNVETIITASRSRWQRSLTSEREARLSKRTDESVTGRSLQALRGHTTRALYAELAEQIKEF